MAVDAVRVRLVPSQNGIGGHIQLAYITNDGDRNLRRSFEALRAPRGHNRSIVALANKVTHLAYRALRSEGAFDMRPPFAAAT